MRNLLLIEKKANEFMMPHRLYSHATTPNGIYRFVVLYSFRWRELLVRWWWSRELSCSEQHVASSTFIHQAVSKATSSADSSWRSVGSLDHLDSSLPFPNISSVWPEKRSNIGPFYKLLACQTERQLLKKKIRGPYTPPPFRGPIRPVQLLSEVSRLEAD